MRVVVVILLTVAFVLLARECFAEVAGFTFATWKSCGARGCYALHVEQGGMSVFMVNRLFVRGLRLDLHRERTEAPRLSLVADRGFWIQDENLWVLLKAHEPGSSAVSDYYFDANSMKLTRAGL